MSFLVPQYLQPLLSCSVYSSGNFRFCSDLESAEDEEDQNEVSEGVVNKEKQVDIQMEQQQSEEHEAAAESTIPYTFDVPGSYTSFVQLLDKYSLKQQNLVIDRMRKCNHPSLSPNNKQHLTVCLYIF